MERIERLTDSHCHLGMVEMADELLERARARGVRGFIVPGTRGDDSADVVRIAGRHADVWAAVGFHPHEAKDLDDDAFDAISRLSADETVVAIGEIGLDYHYDHSPRDLQREALRRQIELAIDRDLPVIVHNRESTEDLLTILHDYAGRVRGVLHSYTESAEVAGQLLDLGFFISFSGIVTFRSADALREVARVVPLDRMLIETDTPFLAPVPHRGKPNEPAFVGDVATRIAEVRDVPVDEIAAATAANFERAFGVKIPS